ncbi:MAG: 4-hydroxythreonine-4-phosphate dehydrogenase PdxA [Candidatus Eremiobacteraeota bacterium]|nr:4-hydroxythreonine-4-phosphate dehydrogenase PdxA [Candidatus Eremiobacteraeota bacterium]
MNPPVAVAIGDPNGIGPEIAVKAAAARAAAAAPIVVGDPAVVRWYAERVAPGVPVHLLADDARETRFGAINVYGAGALPTGAFRPGVVDAAAGAATVAAVESALALVRRGIARAIVACPHSETAVNAAGIAFRGYPSLLARLLGIGEDRVFLMLAGGGLRIAHATLHERLADALARLSSEIVEACARAAAETLQLLGVRRPRIGIMAINPHAGEGGLFGDDDERVTVPAAARLRAAGVDADGPTGADALLARRDRDAYVAMYHDQGHIPVKLLAPHASAALAIGAGVLFSSVGHGSAFDIAGRGVADPAATLHAIDLLSSAASSPAAAVRSP